MSDAIKNFDFYKAFSLVVTISVGIWLIRTYAGVDQGLRDFGLICLGAGLGITGSGSRVITVVSPDGERQIEHQTVEHQTVEHTRAE